VYDAPPPPCTWMSTNPGTSSASGISMSAGVGGGPDPQLAIRPPQVSTQPGRQTPCSSTTAPEAITDMAALPLLC
jgi:hypothetical protein